MKPLARCAEDLASLWHVFPTLGIARAERRRCWLARGAPWPTPTSYDNYAKSFRPSRLSRHEWLPQQMQGHLLSFVRSQPLMLGHHNQLRGHLLRRQRWTRQRRTHSQLRRQLLRRKMRGNPLLGLRAIRYSTDWKLPREGGTDGHRQRSLW